MSDETLYAVVALSAGNLPDDQETHFFGNADDAVAHRDRIGGDARVYRMTPLSESGHWDWAVDGNHGHGPMEYVNERAARNCVGTGGTLLRRRSGTAEWVAVAS